MKAVWVWLSALLIAPPPSAWTQSIRHYEARAGVNKMQAVAGLPGQFLTARTLRPGAADTCLSLGGELWAPDVTEIGKCTSGRLEVVGRAGGSNWVSRTYRRRWLVSPTDTSGEREIVLFRAGAISERTRADSTRLTPVWHYRYDDETLRSIALQMTNAPDGGVAIAAEECVNGTGGCAQSFSRYDGRDHPIVLEFLNALERRYPGAVRHGYHVTLLTMRAEAALYSDGDPNCCPSHTAHMRLRLHGDSLALASLQVRP